LEIQSITTADGFNLTQRPKGAKTPRKKMGETFEIGEQSCYGVAPPALLLLRGLVRGGRLFVDAAAAVALQIERDVRVADFPQGGGDAAKRAVN
jgi:hypothetical protein